MADGVIFVESRVFAVRRASRLSDEEYRRLQSLLLANRQAGDVMPGCGGLRKVRFADASRGKGKRGGVRIIYLDLPRAHRVDLITIYSKDEKDDLNSHERKAWKKLVDQLKAEAQARTRQVGGL